VGAGLGLEVGRRDSFVVEYVQAILDTVQFRMLHILIYKIDIVRGACESRWVRGIFV
jgi:hypothetical protein